MAMERSVWIGFDPREADGYAVTRTSLEDHLNRPIPAHGLVLADLRQAGFYRRPTSRDSEGRLFDDISGFPMATEFAISRFLVPRLVKTKPRERNGGTRWALFMDSDMLIRSDLNALFDLADEKYAVMVVKHEYNPPEGVKMDGQVQTRYFRKNWSSVILFNVDHPGNSSLDEEKVNEWPGRDLHGFQWLDDECIGELSPRWNYLVGHNNVDDLTAWGDTTPSIVHFTSGLPSMMGYENGEYADEWRLELQRWAR